MLNNSISESKEFEPSEIQCITVLLQLSNEIIKLSAENSGLRSMYGELVNVGRFFSTNIDVAPHALETLKLILMGIYREFSSKNRI